MRTVAVLILSFLWLVPSSSLAKDELKKSKTKTEVSKKGTDGKKRLGVDQSDFMPSANSFGFITSYRLWYDSLEQTDPKTVNNVFSLATTYSFNKHWSSYASMGVRYRTQNFKVFRENDSDQYYNLTNLNMGIVYTKTKPLKFIARSSNTLNISVPTSERSRYDKHIGNFSYTNFMTSPSWKNFSLFNRFFVDYLWNTQKYSVTTDLINRDFLASNSLGINYFPVSWIGFRMSQRIDYERDLNGKWIQSYGGNFAIFSNIKGFQIFASYINSSYPENDRLDVTFFDKYRRLYSFGLTYAF